MLGIECDIFQKKKNQKGELVNKDKHSAEKQKGVTLKVKFKTVNRVTGTANSGNVAQLLSKELLC
jgi:hypothetical protein